MEVSIIIVNWNAKDLLKNCLKSIYANHPKSEFEIIVVDNNSSDGTVEMILKEFPKVHLIQNKKNFGFAKANNIGIRNSKGKYLALVNSDVEVESGCFDNLVNFMKQNKNIGVVGPLILNPDRSIQATCRYFPSLWRSICEAFWLNKLFRSSFLSAERMLYFNGKTTLRTDVLSGCFWLINEEYLDKVGLLDERFFIYAEDIDWCKRFWEAGYEVVFYPEANAIHHSGGSSTIEPLRFSREQIKARFLYWQKHFSKNLAMSFLIILILHYMLRVLGEVYILIIQKFKNKTINTSHLKNRRAALVYVLHLTFSQFKNNTSVEI
jgi:hypothetical protein